MTMPAAVACPAPLLLPHFGLFLSALRRSLPVTLRLLRLLRLLMLRLRRRAALFLPGPLMVLPLLLLFALDRLSWNLGTLLRLGLGLLLLLWPSLLRRNLRPLFPLWLRLRPTLLLRRLYRLWLLRRLRPRVSLLRRQTLLIPGRFSLLLLLGSLLGRTCLFTVGLLLVLRLGRPLLPIFLFVLLLLTKGRKRSTEGEGQCCGPCQVKHFFPSHLHTYR
jgi:hypothetical protein